jgi:hypothetical protein
MIVQSMRTGAAPCKEKILSVRAGATTCAGATTGVRIRSIGYSITGGGYQSTARARGGGNTPRGAAFSPDALYGGVRYDSKYHPPS